MNAFEGEPFIHVEPMCEPDEKGVYPSVYSHMLKARNPYSYEPFYVFQREDVKADNTVYSDRMQGWDSDKYQKLAEKIFGKLGGDFYADPKLVEQFLQEYNDNPNIVLVDIIEYCNASNGYPVWRLDYTEK